VLSGALETLIEGNTGIVATGIVVLVACGDVVSVVSGRGSGMVVVDGIEVVATTVSTGRGLD
jgi:hypothetical protein